MNIQENDNFHAAEFVLGVLDEPTRAQLARRMATDSDFAQDVTPAPDVWWAIQRDINQSMPLAAVAPVRSRPTAWVGWALAATLTGPHYPHRG